MDAVLSTLFRAQEVVAPNGERLPLHSHISAEEVDFLQDIIGELEPTTTLEVGLGFGVSALCICEALQAIPNARHIIIDPFQFGGQWRGVGMKHLQDAGYADMVDFYEAPSHCVLTQLKTEGACVDFAFIDGFHTLDYALTDFLLIDQILRVGGVVALDDAQWPSVRKLCRFIATNRAYSVYRCLGPGKRLRFPAVRKLISAAGRRSSLVRKLLRAELVLPDEELGLLSDSRCIAFVKEGEDDREGLEHTPF